MKTGRTARDRGRKGGRPPSDGGREEGIEFEHRARWRDWLRAHHGNRDEVWLVLRKKKHRRTSFGLDEAVEEALCFGWIDSRLKPLDPESYLLRFSPRRKDGVWSKSNVDRVKRLTAEGRMRGPGLARVEEAKADGRWDAALAREDADAVPADLKNALRRSKGATAGFRSLTRSRKKQLLYWLETARRDETRKARIGKIVDEAGAGSAKGAARSDRHRPARPTGEDP